MRLVLTIAIIVALVGLSAQAQTGNCADRGKIVERLENGYGEEYIGGGYRVEGGDGFIYEVFRGDDTGTWTILRTDANGISCVMAAGTHWREMAPAIEGIDG